MIGRDAQRALQQRNARGLVALLRADDAEAVQRIGILRIHAELMFQPRHGLGQMSARRIELAEIPGNRRVVRFRGERDVIDEEIPF